jgi:hypothetical protein
VVIDAVRCIKLAMDRGIAGPLEDPSSYFMKTPPHQYTDHEARERTEAFIRGDIYSPVPVAHIPESEATPEEISTPVQPTIIT